MGISKRVSCDEGKFPDSYPMAVKWMEALDQKPERDPVLKGDVCQQIKDYQAKGYAHKISRWQNLKKHRAQPYGTCR